MVPQPLNIVMDVIMHKKCIAYIGYVTLRSILRKKYTQGG